MPGEIITLRHSSMTYVEQTDDSSSESEGLYRLVNEYRQDLLEDGIHSRMYAAKCKGKKIGNLLCIIDSEEKCNVFTNISQNIGCSSLMIAYIVNKLLKIKNFVLVSKNQWDQQSKYIAEGQCFVSDINSEELLDSNPLSFEIEQLSLDEYNQYSVLRYTIDLRDKWEKFISQSINGTFLQSQQFFEYHYEGKFKDDSIIIMRKGKICAIIPGVECTIDSAKTYYSHRGSTFGGIILNNESYNIDSIKFILRVFEDYLYSNNYKSVILKNTSPLFCNTPTELLYYYLNKYNYEQYSELSFYIDCSEIPENTVESFSRHKRKHYKESLRFNMEFKEFSSKEDICKFYDILTNNLKLHNRAPTHSLEEMLDLYNNRLHDRIKFYGAYYEGKMVAGTMMFIFSEDLVHTQYIASDYDYSETYCTYFLYGQMIDLVKNLGYKTLSFGISTEECGKYLNEGLASLKEGFGSKYLVNSTHFKNLL